MLHNINICEGGRGVERERERERQRQRHRERETDRQRQRETDRERDRDREKKTITHKMVYIKHKQHLCGIQQGLITYKPALHRPGNTVEIHLQNAVYCIISPVWGMTTPGNEVKNHVLKQTNLMQVIHVQACRHWQNEILAILFNVCIYEFNKNTLKKLCTDANNKILLFYYARIWDCSFTG